MDDTAVIVFLKAPEPGNVKTRLGRDRGSSFALNLYQGFVLDLLDFLAPLESVFVYFWPPGKKNMVRQFVPLQFPVFKQAGNDLGEKMANAFLQVFSDGYERAILIGTDIPEISLSTLKRAGKTLEGCDAVFGPSVDGGYYLVGFNKDKFESDLFDNIQWSTPDALSQTLAALEKRNISWGLSDPLEDIDTMDALERLKARVDRNPECVGKRTQTVLKNDDT